MQTRLVAYEALNAVQAFVGAIEVHPEQLPFCGDMYCALNTLLVNPSPGIKGFALLADDVPVAFLLLKCPPCLPHWADAHSATLHALQVDRSQQGRGFGKACLQALPAAALQAWPQIKALELPRDTRTMSRRWACTWGWAGGSRKRHKGRVGYERRLSRGLEPQ